MRTSLLSILPVLALFLILAGCRCGRRMSSDFARTDTAALDLSAHSYSFLRDTLAERQTIRIEYYYPYYLWLAKTDTLDCQLADTVPPAAVLHGTLPKGAGGGVPAIKSIEIVNERNSGSSQTSTSDSTRLSRSSTKETLQEEAASEARQDNTTVIIVCVVGAVLVLLMFFQFLKWLRR